MQPTPTSEPARERLQKYLSRCGVASRRGAEELIAAGRVAVNGETVTGMGTLVNAESDTVEVDGVRVAPPQAHTYLLLNKPAGYVTTLDDPQGRPTVADLIPKGSGRLFPVGRLDLDTRGLLLLTDDGDLAHMLMHPRYHVPKTYLATVDGHPDAAALQRLREGVQLDDGLTQPAEVELVRVHSSSADVRIVLREGRKRQVRRMFSAVGRPVLDLVRVGYGPLDLTGVAEGESRELRAEEVAGLREAAGASDTARSR